MQQFTISKSEQLSSCVGCIISLYSLLSFAGEMLKPNELVNRSDAIAMIKVDLKRKLGRSKFLNGCP